MNKTIVKKSKGRTITRKKYKKMNCNPLVEGKTVLKNSCFTIQVLNKIKTEFNHNHQDNPILSTEYNDLYIELKQRLNNCDKEDCWLEQIKDKKLKDTIDNMSFAPDKPFEWTKKPNTWLSNFDILDVLKQYELKYTYFKFIGPSPIDFDTIIPDNNNKCVWEDICNFDLNYFIKHNITKIGIIFNLDKHNQDGSHWVSLFIDIDNNFLFFFDSNGDKIKNEIDILVKRIITQGKLINKNFTFYENAPFEHQQGNSECGMYSLFFIISMLTLTIGKHKFKNHNLMINYFKTTVIPDKFVFKYRNKYFNGGKS